MVKFWGRLLTASFIALTLAGSAHAEDKIQPAAAIAALEKGTTRVIIVTRADGSKFDGGNAFRRPASYVANQVAKGLSNVAAIGNLPMATAVVTPEALAALRDDPNIALVVKDELRRPTLMDSVPLTGATTHIKAGFTGKGWTVAVVDSGIDRAHVAFKNALRSEGCFSTTVTSGGDSSQSLCKDGAPRVFGPGSAANCDVNDMPECFHGTHVAGIVAGRPTTLTDGRVVAGMAPEAGLIIAKVFSKVTGEQACGQGVQKCMLTFDSDVIAALDWIYAKRFKYKIAAVNMSLGGGQFRDACDSTSPYTEIFQRLRDAGIAVVVAAGNESFTDSLDSPACVSSAISVSATDKTGKIDERYSNVSRLVTLAAPGSAILSAYPGNFFAASDGTSMAAPHVAGAFALLREEHPDATVTELVQLLQQRGKTITDSRTGTILKMIDLATIQPGTGTITALLQSPRPAGGDGGFAQQVKLAAYGASDMRTVIVQSGLPAEEIRNKLGATCTAAEGCEVTRIADGTYRVTVPMAYIESLDQAQSLANGLETQIQGVIGGDSRVFRDGLNRPQMTSVAPVQATIKAQQ
jgi:subtilisin family serine protease